MQTAWFRTPVDALFCSTGRASISVPLLQGLSHQCYPKPLSHLGFLYNASVTCGFTKSHILFIREPGRVHIDLVPSFVFNFLCSGLGLICFKLKWTVMW